MSKYFFIILSTILLFDATGVRAQSAYNGDLTIYEKQVENAIALYYQLTLECAIDPDSQDRLFNSIKQTYVLPSGIFVPDFVKYENPSLTISYENYVVELADAYKSKVNKNKGIDILQNNVQIIQAEWTKDGKGVILNVTYDNVVEIGRKSVYKGKSQALICFPDITNMLSYRFQQISPLGWKPGMSTSKVTFAQALKSYSRQDFKQSLQQFKQLADQGEPDAYGFIGNHYIRGLGTQTDSVTGDHYYAQTFKHRTPYSFYFQSLNYLLGRGGVKPDTIQAFRLAKKSAEANNPYGINLLATYYKDNIGVKPNLKKAIKLFEKAKKMGLSTAYYNLGWMYLLGEGVPKDKIKAFEHIKKSVELGGTYYGILSYFYREGIGCNKDADQAMHMAKQGVTCNDNLSYSELGLCYWERREENPAFEKEAIRYFEIADQKELDYTNNILSIYYFENNKSDYWWKILNLMESYQKIGVLTGYEHYMLSEIYLTYTRKQQLALEHIKMAYKEGDKNAIDKIGDYYYYGYGMRTNDHKLAYKYYYEAVQKGGGQCSYYGISKCLLYGQGVAKDIPLALKYFETGAEKGYPFCCYFLGDLYRNGSLGYTKNLSLAEAVYQRGSRNEKMEGTELCMAMLGLMHVMKETKQPDQNEARRLWEQADRLNDGYAAYLIGFGYEHGQYGYTKDTAKAIGYYQKSSDRGNKIGAQALKDLRNKMSNSTTEVKK